jgi:hypothetical protein
MGLAKDCGLQRFQREFEGASLLGGLSTWLLWRLGLENGTGKLGMETTSSQDCSGTTGPASPGTSSKTFFACCRVRMLCIQNCFL